MNTTTTGPLYHTHAGAAYPVTLTATLADGTTYADRDAWIIIWEYTPTGPHSADLVITTGREDHTNPGRIIPGPDPRRVAYHTGQPISSGSLTWQMDDTGERPLREYTGLSPENAPDVIAEAMIERASALEGWEGERLTTSQAARLIGVKPATFRSYVTRGLAPKADGHVDARTPYWLRSTITQWQAKKDGQPGPEPR